MIVLSGIPKQNSIFNGSDLNDHVGRDADGYGGMRFGTRNAEGEMILEFDDAVGIAVCNTFFKKEDYANYLRPDPGYVVKQCPRIVMNRILDWY